MTRALLRYRVLGNHVHCLVYTSPDPPLNQWAHVGTLTFPLDEWEDLQRMLHDAGMVIQPGETGPPWITRET